MTAKFTPLRSGDDKIDRAQDEIARAITSFAGAGSKAQALTAQPKPAASSAFAIIAVTSKGNPTRVYICLPNSKGGYEWLSLGQST